MKRISKDKLNGVIAELRRHNEDMSAARFGVMQVTRGRRSRSYCVYCGFVPNDIAQVLEEILDYERSNGGKRTIRQKEEDYSIGGFTPVRARVQESERPESLDQQAFGQS